MNLKLENEWNEILLKWEKIFLFETKYSIITKYSYFDLSSKVDTSSIYMWTKLLPCFPAINDCYSIRLA